jgi:HAD superfamily hydrolase (TIGR01509 family)
MNQKKLIIFDFDGVIIDSWEHSYKRNVRDWPHMKPHEHKSLFNGNIHEEIEKMPPSVVDKEETQRWLAAEYFPQKMSLPLFEGIHEVIKKLSKKNTLVINTSATSTSTKEYLKGKEMDAFFDAIYGMEFSKDKIKKFKQILKDYDVRPEDCIFVTDTVGDVLEAQHCSISSLAVTYGYQDRSYFGSIENEVIGFADKPADILNFINN